MEVTLKDESGVAASSILEKSIALTNEVQVKLDPPALNVLENVTTDLETVPENKVLNPEPAQLPVGEKLSNAMSSAVSAVVDGVKGLVDHVKPKSEPEAVVAAQPKVIPTYPPYIEIPAMKSLADSLAQSLPNAPTGDLTVEDDNLSKSLPDESTPLDTGVKVEQLTPTVCLVQEKFIVEAVQVGFESFALCYKSLATNWKKSAGGQQQPVISNPSRAHLLHSPCFNNGLSYA